MLFWSLSSKNKHGYFKFGIKSLFFAVSLLFLISLVQNAKKNNLNSKTCLKSFDNDAAKI